MHHKLSPAFAGFLQAIGIITYVFLVNWVMGSGFWMFMPDASVMLLLLCFSALVCGSIVLGYPFSLVLHKRYREAMIVFASTVVTMGVLLVVWVSYLYSMNVGQGYY